MVNDTEKATSTILAKKFILDPSSKDGILKRQDVMMFEVLFENMLDVYFYVKDKDRQWISCNTTSLELLNLSKVEDVIGKKEENFFPKNIAESIRKDDEKIINNCEKVLNRIELITNQYGELIWVNTNKLPVCTINGQVVGIVGITRPISDQKGLPKKYKLFSGVIDYIRNNLDKPITVSDLAEAASLSDNKLRRKFKQEFALTPKAFVQRARLQTAAHLLRSHDITISQVAQQSGFTDQSYFTRQFKAFFGETPKGYSQLWKSDIEK